ncbi:MAG: EAL domain-containing protein [Deinococcales bacterium]
MPFGILALLLGIFFEGLAGQPTTFDNVSYPVMAAGMTLLELLVLIWPRSLRPALTTAVAGTGAFFVGKLALLLFALPAGVDAQHELTETFFWIPTVYLLSFLLPGGRGGRALAAAFTGVVLAMSLLFIASPALHGQRWGLVYALTEMNLANTVQLALTFALIGLKEAYARARTERHLAQRFARQDLLTGLPNRRALEADLEALIEANDDARAAVLFLDLDGFKVINDTLGHEAGDTLLKLVAERLAGAMREGDLVARMSGDEFVVVAGGLRSRSEAGDIARRIFTALSQSFTYNGSQLGLTLSIGVAFLPDDGRDARTLLRHADSAMYRVKRSGKNGLKYYSPEIDASMERRGELERDLRTALREEQMSLAFQPVFDMRDGSLRQVEALLRWQHPRYGAVSPAEFIPLAEESGVIVALGGWALEEACRQAGSLRAALPDLRVSVNVSALQLAQPSFFGDVVKALQQAGLPADALELDLGESIVRGPVEDVQGTLRGLRGLGVGIAIDDFGRGFSSLAYLRDLPVDAVKIAREVVHDLGASEEVPRFGLAMMEAILGLARHLDLTIVAEGVETRAQFERLLALGCHRAQGFFFAPPMPGTDVQVLVARGGVSTLWGAKN